jgi:ubiquitin carboxyl-terminal hydrolase L5
MASEAAWSLTESDPAIFTSLLQDLGVAGAEVTELYSLDDSGLLEAIKPIYAFIFLFKWVDTAGQAASTTGDVAQRGVPKQDAEFYFAHQVINNACATMALLNATMNIADGSNVKLGSQLEELKSFSLALDPDSRGWAVSNTEKIREGTLDAAS